MSVVHNQDTGMVVVLSCYWPLHSTNSRGDEVGEEVEVSAHKHQCVELLGLEGNSCIESLAVAMGDPCKRKGRSRTSTALGCVDLEHKHDEREKVNHVT